MSSSGKYQKKSFFPDLIVALSQWEPVLKAPEPILLQKAQRWKCRENLDVKYLLGLIFTGKHYFSQGKHTVSYFIFKTVQSITDIEKKEIRRNPLPNLCWCLFWALKMTAEEENIHVEFGMDMYQSGTTYVFTCIWEHCLWVSEIKLVPQVHPEFIPWYQLATPFPCIFIATGNKAGAWLGAAMACFSELSCQRIL